MAPNGRAAFARPFHLGFGGMRLQGRLFAATHVPNRQHFERVGRDTVIDEVSNAADQQSANAFGPCALVGSADAGLLYQQSQGVANVCTNGAWRCWSVFGPPFSGLADM